MDRYGNLIDMTLPAPFVKASRTGAVLRLTLSRPEQRNALSLGMLNAIMAELAAAESDRSVHVIVIAAQGPVFSAGHDLKELTDARAAPDAGAAFFSDTFATCEKLMLAISTGPKPVIAEVQGLATAAGCQLVASCDIAIASRHATFATPGVNIGLFCSTPAVPVVRAIGPKLARHMLFTGEPISADQALSAGLISEITAPETLTASVNHVAQQIASRPPEVMSLGKATLLKQEQMPMHEAYALATKAMLSNLQLPAANLGIAGFLARKSDKSLK
jgi:enoyl-CoA hydratase/carnithine racemase